MASVGNRNFFNKKTLTANEIGVAPNLQEGASGFIALLKLENAAGASVGGTLEHSPDGTNWIVFHTFTGLAADGVEVAEITASLFPRVRANLTASGSSDVTCQLWFDPQRT